MNTINCGINNNEMQTYISSCLIKYQENPPLLVQYTVKDLVQNHL